VHYELNSRPDWADIPLRAVLSIIGTPGKAAGKTPEAISGAAAAGVGAEDKEIGRQGERETESPQSLPRQAGGEAQPPDRR
jgi:hypothetical protein